ncbi:DUF3078 domain-containing protein [Marinilabiliaceae bacterium JC017]|nr:DUF3078 domain-containing protein [Marinilabiliaceae bacterium JC017]
MSKWIWKNRLFHIIIGWCLFCPAFGQVYLLPWSPAYFFEIQKESGVERMDKFLNPPTHFSSQTNANLFYLKVLANSFNELVKKDFNYYRRPSNWKVSQKYMLHSLSLMFKVPDYPSIVYRPGELAKEKLNEYRKVLSCTSNEDSIKTLFPDNIDPLYGIMQDDIMNRISDVKYIWDSIPEPHRAFWDKRYLSTRQVEKELSRLLINREDFDTKYKLEKRNGPERIWTWEGTENVQFSQVHLENWAKGGESSLSLMSDLRVKAKYKKGKNEWESYAIHKIGILTQGEDPGRVNDDMLEINSKYGLNASKKWYYSALTNFKTQLFYGYKKDDKLLETPISGFMAPAYLTFAVGMDYKGSDNFTLMLSPLTSRLTMVLDTVKFDQTAYNIPEDKKAHFLNGGSVVNNFKWKIGDEFELNSKLDAFYEYFSEEKQIQFDWEVILDMRINVWLSTRLLANLRYYDNESDKWQLRENFSVAFRYIFK